MEKKIIKAEDVFKIIDYRAEWLYKDSNGKICWSVEQPKFTGNYWLVNTYVASGCLGYVDIEEFQDIAHWKDCLYKKEEGIKKIDTIDYLQSRIDNLEQEIEVLKTENQELKNQLYYKNWTYPKQPTITYFNNEEK